MSTNNPVTTISSITNKINTTLATTTSSTTKSTTTLLTTTTPYSDPKCFTGIIKFLKFK